MFENTGKWEIMEYIDTRHIEANDCVAVCHFNSVTIWIYVITQWHGVTNRVANFGQQIVHDTKLTNLLYLILLTT